ncbi:MAG: hypothetical protein KDA42_02585 [Planctomycetales bacterium]|nr:hypothetical protein [Planctomycetales bacterium]
MAIQNESTVSALAFPACLAATLPFASLAFLRWSIVVAGLVMLLAALVILFLLVASLLQLWRRSWKPSVVGLALSFFCTLWMLECCNIAASAALGRWTGPGPYVPPADNVIAAARLAPLPASAAKIQTHGWGGLFTGETYLRCELEPAEIERWLNACQQHSVAGEDPSLATSESNDRCWGVAPQRPAWFPAQESAHFRRFQIRANAEHHNWGEVIVDDELHVVYVNVIWS